VSRKLNKELLLNDIRSKGVEISSINDLIKMDMSFKDLVPILLKHIQEIDDESDKQFLVRCLGVKGYTEATEQLITEFHKSENPSYKWAIGNTLSIIQDRKHVHELIEIVKTKQHGRARQMIVIALGKMKVREAIPFLIELLSDEVVVGHVISALGYYKDPIVIQYLEPFKNHKVWWVKNEASKVIGKLQKL
jgi:HEAT repeat protein